MEPLAGSNSPLIDSVDAANVDSARDNNSYGVVGKYSKIESSSERTLTQNGITLGLLIRSKSARYH